MGIITAAVVAAALVSVGCGSSSNGQPTPSATIAQLTHKTVTIDTGDNPSKGPANAKVTIVEFADFQGANSASFALQTLPQILSNYGDKVRFVFLNTILESSTYSEKAAEAGECANAQGFFWQYHDLLFQNQKALAALVTPNPTPAIGEVVDNLKAYAAQLGLDTAKFDACLDSGEMATALQSDDQVATKAIQEAGFGNFPVSIPAFFINGNFLTGAKSYDVFQEAIDAALAATR